MGLGSAYPCLSMYPLLSEAFGPFSMLLGPMSGWGFLGSETLRIERDIRTKSNGSPWHGDAGKVWECGHKGLRLVKNYISPNSFQKCQDEREMRGHSFTIQTLSWRNKYLSAA